MSKITKLQLLERLAENPAEAAALDAEIRQSFPGKTREQALSIVVEEFNARRQATAAQAKSAVNMIDAAKTQKSKSAALDMARSALVTAQDVLTKFESLTGPAASLFFRENRKAIRAAQTRRVTKKI